MYRKTFVTEVELINLSLTTGPIITLNEAYSRTTFITIVNHPSEVDDFNGVTPFSLKSTHYTL